ncbi:hypothetical protein BYT27DRAFT_7235158 [Phlegmacium glaucopus]|nr:hypothetical protein BYT27DRAFT_7235158 [Phlegmacium glaucopus]
MAAANPHTLSLDSAVELLTLTMRDPMKANVCTIRLSVAADRIDQALESCTSNSAKAKIAKSYPELLRAGIKFLMFKQSPQDYVAMVNHLVKCHCDFSQAGMGRLHKPSRDRIDGRVQVDNFVLLFDAVATLSNCLILALSDLTQHNFRTGNMINGEQRWPQGPEDSLVSLEHWVAGAPLGYIIFKLVGCLALFHVPFAREVFQSPNFTFALARPVQHLEQAVKFYEEGESSPLARTHLFTYPVMTIFEFFGNLLRFDTPQFNTMMVVRGPWISPILARLMTILSTLPPSWGKTRFLARYIKALANAERDPATGVSVIKFERSEVLAELPYLDRLQDAFHTMVEARKKGCWNITCSSASEAIHSRLCSKCNLIRFCGEKCQKEAWKCATLPHKSVCANIYSLRVSFGADNWSLLWTPDFTYAQFQVMCEMKTVDTKVVRAIASTLSSLRARQSAFREDLKKAGASQIDRLVRAAQDKLALQMVKDVMIRDGHVDEPLTIVKREDALSMMSSDAYR